MNGSTVSDGGARTRLLLCVCLLTASVGCATADYKWGRNIECPETLKLAEGEPQFVRGRPHKFLDGLGHYAVSLPAKLMLWNWKVENHDISPETEEKLRVYLERNDLKNVKVRLNQYSPGAEWKRLGRNRAVHPAWRYPLGGWSLCWYTIFPGRVFGGDNYNPYTNTINIYSDLNSIVIHEAGHAKDFAGRKYKGIYSALRMLPLVPLYQEAIATSDALSYDLATRRTGDMKEDYKVLYPAFGSYVGGEAEWAIADPLILYSIKVGAVLCGHIVGRIKAAGVREAPLSEEAAAPLQEPDADPASEAASAPEASPSLGGEAAEGDSPPPDGQPAGPETFP